MKITNDGVAVVAIGGILVLGIVCVISSIINEKKFKEYKNDILKDRDLDDAIDKASIKNPSLNVDERVIAKRTLTWIKDKIDTANRTNLLSRLNLFDNIVNGLLLGSPEERSATVQYWKSQLEMEAERIKMEATRSLELEKAKLIKDSLKALKTDVNINMAQLDPLLS